MVMVHTDLRVHHDLWPPALPKPPSSDSVHPIPDSDCSWRRWLAVLAHACSKPAPSLPEFRPLSNAGRRLIGPTIFDLGPQYVGHKPPRELTFSPGLEFPAPPLADSLLASTGTSQTNTPSTKPASPLYAGVSAAHSLSEVQTLCLTPPCMLTRGTVPSRPCPKTWL